MFALIRILRFIKTAAREVFDFARRLVVYALLAVVIIASHIADFLDPDA